MSISITALIIVIDQFWYGTKFKVMGFTFITFENKMLVLDPPPLPFSNVIKYSDKAKMCNKTWNIDTFL